jgi:pimeloyl-ACP methyl ester carboxylesterase
VVSLDARGHGDSDWSPDGRYTFEILASDLKCVLRTLRSAPVIVGASMGGATGLYLVGLASCPPVTALVLVDIVPRIEARGESKILKFMESHSAGFASLAEAADAVAAYNPLRPRSEDSAGLMKNLRKRADGRLYWHWDPRMLSLADRERPNYVADLLTASATRVRVPTLLVRGLRSDIVSDVGVAELKQQIPQLEVFDVAHAGHMVVGDSNAIFNDALFAFLQRYLPPPAPS